VDRQRHVEIDLSLELVATGGAPGFFEYSTDLFKQETIAQMAVDFERVLRGLVDHPDVPLSDLEVVNEVRSRMLRRPEAG